MLGTAGGDYQIASAVRIFAGDGSVHVVHGGCEIGQGIHTKVAQAVAYALGCPLDLVAVGPTSTTQAPNSTSTGGSGPSEVSVRSALAACDKINGVLAPYRTPSRSWAEVVHAAAAAGGELHASGWFNMTTDKTFAYATYGVCAVEVELDILTGEIAILGADLLMDQGTPLNPSVDLGEHAKAGGGACCQAKPHASTPLPPPGASIPTQARPREGS